MELMKKTTIMVHIGTQKKMLKKPVYMDKVVISLSAKSLKCLIPVTIDKMLYIEEKVNQKDSENKEFKLKIVIIASFAFIGAVAGLASILGTNTGISIPNLKTNIPTK